MKRAIKVFFMTYLAEIVLVSIVSLPLGKFNTITTGEFLFYAGLFLAVVFLLSLNRDGIHARAWDTDQDYCYGDQKSLKLWEQEQPIQEAWWAIVLASAMISLTGYFLISISSSPAY